MTRVRIGLENGIEGRSLAWALDYPGCFAYGKDESEAVLNLPRAMVQYRDWIERHGEASWLADLNEMDFALVQVFEVYCIDENYENVPEGYEVNAWFQHDWKPLTAGEVERGLTLLSWSRQDLLQLAADVPEGKMDVRLPGERWSIRGVLEHVANAEWWYLDRLGLADRPRSALPADYVERLAFVRARLEDALPGLAGREDMVVGRDGEFWSPRKLLRRALWHEKDHIGHISRLILES